MDKILNPYLILIIYLLAAAYWDIRCLAVPMRVNFFAFSGWLVCTHEGRLESLAAASAAALFVYFIFELFGRIRKSAVLGRGDIYIIFIIGLFLEFDVFLNAVFLACIFALVMACMLCIFTGPSVFPLAPAFLFGTLAALW